MSICNFGKEKVVANGNCGIEVSRIYMAAVTSCIYNSEVTGPV